MRCWSLGEALSQLGWQTKFAAVEATFECCPIVPTNARTILSGATDGLEESCELLVVDHYGLDRCFESSARRKAACVLVIDDLVDREHDCDILLDSATQHRDQAYKQLVPDECVFLFGPRYALLRPQFIARRNELDRLESVRDSVQRILISFGGSDTEAEVAMTLAGLKEANVANDSIVVDLVLSRESSRTVDLKRFAMEMPYPVEVYVNVDDMAAMMMRADISIGAAGSTSWERCCLQLPSVILCIAENQRVIASELEAAGAAINLGASGTVVASDICRAVRRLIDDGAARGKMGLAAGELCDGRGAERVSRFVSGEQNGLVE